MEMTPEEYKQLGKEGQKFQTTQREEDKRNKSVIDEMAKNRGELKTEMERDRLVQNKILWVDYCRWI